ncbi:acyl carrier protein [Mycoplasmopsis primatum]|uniref:acyl carrier protein n=1 Tax=Mycoplasmopsis primatum TaxID=55604 RepID=UPI00056506E0|nr:acyl carrier protein [Mycoplasmopsis primatum]
MNNKEKILKEIIDKIQSLTKIKVTLDSSFKDLKIDSLSLAELIFDLEDKYNVLVPDEDLKNIKVVGDIETIFNKLLK